MSAAQLKVFIPDRNHSPHATLVLPLTTQERNFILHRLQQVTSLIEGILHEPNRPGGSLVPQWSRETMVRHAWHMIGNLRQSPSKMLIIGEAQQRLLVEVIETHRYFMLPPGDPRLNVHAIRCAEALRLKISALLGRKIKRFQIGLDRNVHKPVPKTIPRFGDSAGGA